jgi:hypothetical protein
MARALAVTLLRNATVQVRPLLVPVLGCSPCQVYEAGPSMTQQVVERILRDVLASQGLRVSMQRVEPTPDGWRIVVTDSAHRVLTTELRHGTPAAIRAALIRWTDVAPDPA